MNLQMVPIGQYYPGNSLLHRLDPRTKILAVLLLSVLLFVVRGWGGYLVVVLFTLLALVCAQVPPQFVWRGLRPILLFLLIAEGFNLFLTPGEPLYRIGFLEISREGAVLAGVTLIRLVLLVITASLLTLTTSPIRLTDGLERLLRPLAPLGVPVHEFALMMTIALRFIPTLVEEAERIIRAQSARGASFHSGGLLRRIRGLIPVMVPLFVAAFRRADELATAMEARGYRGGQGRTRMKELVFSAVDYAAWAVLAFYGGSILWLR